MKALPYYRWYPADAETDEKYASLNREELGLYHQCLNKAWLNNGLPSEEAAIGKLMKLTPGELKRLWPSVSKLFYVRDSDGRLVSKRQEEERADAIAKGEANKRPGNANATREKRERVSVAFFPERDLNANAAQHARARAVSDSLSVYGSVSDSVSEGGVGENGTERIASSAAEAGIPKPAKRAPLPIETPLTRLCRDWMLIYPNKIDLDAAGREWHSLIRDEDHAKEVIAGTERYLASSKWRDARGELCADKAKSPMYFLRDGNYRDNPAPYRLEQSRIDARAESVLDAAKKAHEQIQRSKNAK